MPYYLDIGPTAQADLRNLTGLSREGRNKLFAHLDLLRHVDVSFLTDPVNRVAGELVFTTIFRDGADVRAFKYRVDDSAASVGVLKVLAVEDVSP